MNERWNAETGQRWENAPQPERVFQLSMQQVGDLPLTEDELLELPKRLHMAVDSWKVARELYEANVISLDELDAVRAGVRAILGLPVDE